MNISDVIIVAIISAIVNLGVAYLQNRTKGIEREKEESARNQHIDDCFERFDDRFDAIETRLDEHNHYAKKFEEVNMKIGKIDNKIDLLQKDFEYCKR